MTNFKMIIETLKKISWRRILLWDAIAFGIVIVILHGALVWVNIVDHWIMPLWRMPPPLVTVAQVKKQDVPLYLDYVGTSSSINSVDVRARVEGFLTERYFVEGDDVNEGDLMYVIDERPFQAKLDEAMAQMAKDEATLSYANEQVVRYKKLVDKQYVSREAYDNYVTQAASAKAVVDADRAAVETAALNLSYCRMYALISGRIGRTKIEVGNLVGSGDSTVLATIVKLDPIYVYFSPSDKDLRKIFEKRQDGSEIPVMLTFQDGTSFKHEGAVNFIDNVVDKGTSTVAMRAIIPNPEKTLLPGIYVDTHLRIGEQKDALLVPETALDQTQEGNIIFVVDKNDRAAEHIVKIGSKSGKDRVILEGLNENDTVITEGLNKVKPGMKVTAKPNP